MVGIEWETLIGPIREEVDEPTLAQQVLGSEQKHLRDARTGETRVEKCAGIVYRNSSIRFDHKPLAFAMKFPWKWLAGLRITEFDAPMGSAPKFLRCCRPSPAAEVRR
jgi:hypothetical protein